MKKQELFSFPYLFISLLFRIYLFLALLGCLWFIPGSHRGELATRWIRGGKKPPSMVLTKEGPNYPEHGKFVALPVAKGSCVLIHGLVVHKSELNNSEQGRPVYAFHVAETKDTKWSAENWLQPTAELPFTPLFSTQVWLLEKKWIIKVLQ